MSTSTSQTKQPKQPKNPTYLGLATFYICNDPYHPTPYFNWALCTSSDPTWQSTSMTYQIIRNSEAPLGWKRWIIRTELTTFQGFAGVIHLADLTGVCDEMQLGQWIEEIDLVPDGNEKDGKGSGSGSTEGGAISAISAMCSSAGHERTIAELVRDAKVVSSLLALADSAGAGRPGTLSPGTSLDQGWSCISWCLEAIMSMADGGMIELPCNEQAVYGRILGKCKDILLMRQDQSFRYSFPIVDFSDF